MIGNWLRTYFETGVFQCVRTTRAGKYTSQQHIWLYNYYQYHPPFYLDEAQDSFRRAHGTEISKTSVLRLIHSLGLTWKVVGRRAVHIKELDVLRFGKAQSHQLESPEPRLHRRDGSQARLRRLRNRLEFIKCCQYLVHTEKGSIRQYPGPNSIWVMDRATFHRHPEIIPYLRSVGVVVSSCWRIVHFLILSSFSSDTLGTPFNDTTQTLTSEI
ncbi:hypothetical protein PHPALM_28936 [Phytophthora palmivora]|uniref:Winged helix-turn helix domain-containing protein n=1 Tax=Phytophthora palmivora TaxID=4796 RepID=A0A2P4X8V1_9STRA|nr:hypothetical protein PHPALM_28936 [Phytophthora palmivora]